MINFKDLLDADLKATFFNPREFAEPHDINGEVIDCVIDQFQLKEHGERELEGVFLDALTIYVIENSIPKPLVGEVMMVDDRMYFVRNVVEEMGSWVIMVEANDQ